VGSQSDQMTNRVRHLVSRIVDEYGDNGVPVSKDVASIPSDQLMQTVSRFMDEAQLKFVTYIVEEE